MAADTLTHDGDYMKARLVFAAVCVSFLFGCASSAIVVGKVRPPISPAQVKLYLNPPKKYEEIALLESSSKASWAISDQGKMNVVIERLKEEAAKIGANGVLLRGTGEQNAGSVGTASFNGGVALGISSNIMHKAGNGVAIFVEAE